MDDLISRQTAIDALSEWESSCTWDEWINAHNDQLGYVSPSDVITELPSAQHFDNDGTLWIKVDDIDKVKRVIVDHRPWCKVFYQDAQPEIVRCKDCKHYEEINQPYPQMFCRRHQLDTLEDDYCSYGERGDDEDTV